MLHDLAKNDGYVALKRVAEEREVWRPQGSHKTALHQKTAVLYFTIHCIIKNMPTPAI